MHLSCAFSNYIGFAQVSAGNTSVIRVLFIFFNALKKTLSFRLGDICLCNTS